MTEEAEAGCARGGVVAVGGFLPLAFHQDSCSELHRPISAGARQTE